MRAIKYFTTIAILILCLAIWHSCGGGGSAPGSPTMEVIAVESSFEGSQQSVSLEGRIVLDFGQPMDTASFTDETAYYAGTGNIPANVEWSENNSVGTFTSSQSLDVCQDYALTIEGSEVGVKTADGNYMSEDVTVAFSTIYKYGDEFDNAETLSKCWTTTSGSDTYAAIDINTTNAGKLTFRFSNTNHTRDNLDVPAISKSVSGNFCISFFISYSNHEAVNGGGAYFSIDDQSEYGTTFMFKEESIPSIENIDRFQYDGENTPGDTLTHSQTGRTSIYFCLTRNGTTVSAYRSDDGSTWTTYVSADLVWGDPIQISISGQNHFGYDTPIDDYYFTADYIRFNFDDPPTCPGF